MTRLPGNSPIIISPVISEKSLQETAFNRYTFKVNPKANKHQIKLEVEKMFSVDVVKVRTVKLRALTKKSRKTRKTIKVRAVKKAMVQLKPKQKIDLFDVSTK